MSKITSLTPSATISSRRANIVDVNCVYERGYLEDGTPCVVLKTYNPYSQKAGISQTLHITKEVAEELVTIFKRELGI